MAEKRIRPGVVFAWMCGGWMFGIALVSVGLPWWVVVCGSVGITLGSVGISRGSVGIEGRKGWLLPFLLFILFALLGFWRYDAVQPTEYSVFLIADQEKRTLEGTIVRIQESEYGVRLTLRDLVVDGEAFEDRVLVRVPLFSKNEIGQRVNIACNLKRPEPFDGFAYDRYLAAKDIHATCASREASFVVGEDHALWVRFLWVMHVVHRFSVDMIDRVFPDPHAQLLAGLLLGDDAFSQIWNERFLQTGTSHIVAASGSNVALVTSLVFGFLFGAGVSRKYATVFACAGILCFVFLAGAESAVMRAGIMAFLVVLSRNLGRASSVRNVLLCTICVMLFMEPRILRDDVGFQLSVLSTVGLLFWAKKFTDFFSFIPERFGLREGFATTLAATLATLPVTLVSMGQISFVGPLANFFVLPLLPLAMGLGTLATVVGMVQVDIGRWIAFPAWWVLDTVFMVLRALSQLPFAYAEVVWWKVVLGVGGVGVGAWGVCVGARGVRLGAWGLRGERGVGSKKEKKHVGSFLAPCIFVGLFVFSFAQHVLRNGWFASSVHVWVFDVGQGDAIFIDTPGKDVLIDGGPSPIIREKLGMILPWFDRRIDHVFVTHPHADHIVGLVSALEQYAVTFVGESGQGCRSIDCRAFAEVVHASESILAGELFVLADGVTLRAVWPQKEYRHEHLSDPNDGSLVFLLETLHGSMLLTGDAGIEEEWEFLPLLPDAVDVLKVGHHGSRTSTSPALLDQLRPSFGIISLGTDNSYGHPHAEALSNLAEYNVSVVQTNLSGDIRVEFGREGVVVAPWRL